MGTATWVILAAAGGAFMWLMRYTPNLIDFILVRLAAAAFMGAGAAGMTGWMGDAMQWALGWASDTTDRAALALFGAGLVWIAVALVGVIWVGGFLPFKIFEMHMPDWLSISGLVLPMLLVAVPGPLGELLRSITSTIGEWMTSIVLGWV